MAEVLLFREIADRFAGEWVIVADPKMDDERQVKSGRVIAHGPDRGEVFRVVLGMKPRPQTIASLCFRKQAADEAIVL